eukprot:366489-Chlamydomonas_euryale.AAC.7
MNKKLTEDRTSRRLASSRAHGEQNIKSIAYTHWVDAMKPCTGKTEPQGSTQAYPSWVRSLQL